MAHHSKAVDILAKIYQEETAGVIRYLHYSFMIMGHNRIPIQKWFRDQATESMNHAIIIGEKITSLGGHPPMVTPPIEESDQHGVQQLLKECLVHERNALSMYRQLVDIAGDDIALEELARQFVREETEHIEEVEKMLKTSL
ncbi:MAG: ferritin-like domain-containing protein [Proteobacteria bacterium]|nr:ferritin-like domain-containing protein [Pseudomonadota bacterium]